jgi:hypothetical protein
VNHDDLGARRHAREGIGDRVATTVAAGNDGDGLGTTEQIRRRRRHQLAGERHDQIVHEIAIAIRIDTALENGLTAEQEELLGRRAAEAVPSAASRDDGRYMHVIGSGSR